MSDLSSIRQKPAQDASATLGDVLYAKSTAAEQEQDWAKLVQAIAAGDQLALHALYEAVASPRFHFDHAADRRPRDRRRAHHRRVP